MQGHVKVYLSQIPPPQHTHNIEELLHSNIWFSTGLEFINIGCTYARAHELYRKGIHTIADIWDKECRTFISWDDAQAKCSLEPIEDVDWITITCTSFLGMTRMSPIMANGWGFTKKLSIQHFPIFSFDQQNSKIVVMTLQSAPRT